MPLFEIALLELSKPKKDETQTEKLIFGPQCIISKNDKSAANTALIQNAAILKEIDPDLIQVLVRPF